MAGHHERPRRGGTDNWVSPREWLEALGPFNLDPCASDPQPWPTAARMIVLPEDGLAADWGKAFVYMNPPFSSSGAWLARLADHGHGIACVAARTETKKFHAYVWKRATALYFPLGRPTFYTPEGLPGNGRKAGGGFPFVFVGYGTRAAVRFRICRLPGYYIRLRF